MARREIARDVEERQFCYIALDSDLQTREETYVVPDENIITVAPDGSVAQKFCSTLDSLAKKPA